MSSVYVELGKLTERLDAFSKRIEALRTEKKDIDDALGACEADLSNTLAKAEALAKKHNLPFNYSYKENKEDDWVESEDYWNSSDC